MQSDIIYSEDTVSLNWNLTPGDLVEIPNRNIDFNGANCSLIGCYETERDNNYYRFSDVHCVIGRLIFSITHIQVQLQLRNNNCYSS